MRSNWSSDNAVLAEAPCWNERPKGWQLGGVRAHKLSNPAQTSFRITSLSRNIVTVTELKVIKKFFLSKTNVLDGISGITKNIFFFPFEGL